MALVSPRQLEMKYAGLVCCVTHVKEPSTLIVKCRVIDCFLSMYCCRFIFINIDTRKVI